MGVYIKEHIKFKRRHDIEKIVDSFEHMWFEFSGKNKYSSFLLGILYQPHSDNASKELWLNHLEHLISNIMIKWDGVMILAGNMNIDLLKQTQVADKYMRILATFKLTQVIREPTRQGKTLIDHIATNIPKKVVASGVLPCPEISDHDAPYIIANIRVNRFVPRYKYIRNEKSLNVKNFTLDFSRLPFNLVYAVSEPNDKLEIFNDFVQKCLDQHAPRTCTRVTRPPAPWMKDLNIQRLQEQRDLYRYKAHHSGLDSDWKIFRNVRNKIKKVIKDTKRAFYQSALSSKRPKEIWSTIHRILHPNPKPINEDPEKMNAHFSKLAEKLTGRESISCDDLTQIIDNMPSTNSVKFQLRKVYYNEVKKALSSPIPKVDNPSWYDDYRPIAILLVLSKVFENLVLQQMQEFIYIHCLLHDTQSGFRKGHSTITALLKFKDDISKAMKKGEITLAVFADFSKAFNTVDPEVLINKLSKMNFSKSFLHWLISYLSDREQFVQINDKISSKAIIRFGVPQGSLLGPVLFNLYVADMHQNVHPKEECLQYADDSTLYHHCRIEELETAKLNLEQSLSTLNDWSSHMNLVLNETKTMMFSTKQMARYHELDHQHRVGITVNGKSIE